MEVFILCLLFIGLVLWIYKLDDDKKWDKRQANEKIKVLETLKDDPLLNSYHNKVTKACNMINLKYQSLKITRSEARIIIFQGYVGENLCIFHFTLSRDIMVNYKVVGSTHLDIYASEMRTFPSSTTVDDIYPYLLKEIQSSLPN